MKIRFNLKEKIFFFLETVKKALLKNSKAKSLVDEFYYPNQGTGLIYETMAERVRQTGSRIRLSSPIIEINTMKVNPIDLILPIIKPLSIYLYIINSFL